LDGLYGIDVTFYIGKKHLLGIEILVCFLEQTPTTTNISKHAYSMVLNQLPLIKHFILLPFMLVFRFTFE